MSLQQYISSLGAGTWFVLGVNILVFIATLLRSELFHLLMLCPQWVTAGNYEIYRLFTCAFVHGSVQHLAMNSLAALTMSHSLEEKLGTTAFLALTVVSVLVVGPLHLLFSSVYERLPFTSSKSPCVVGFSGVLFTFMYLQSAYGPKERKCYCFTVRSRLLPFAILVLVQAFLPNVSFFGHFSGIVAGVLLEQRLLGWAMPSYEWVEAFDDWKLMKRLQEKAKWQVVPPEGDIHDILSCRFCARDTPLPFRYQSNRSGVEMPEI